MLGSNMKSEFNVVCVEINNIRVDIETHAQSGGSPYHRECVRICEKHGWTLKEYDAELELHVLGPQVH